MTSPVEIAECEKEPIHRPGAIQPHGVLLVLDRKDLRIVEVSQNAEMIFGHAAEELAGTMLADRFPEPSRKPTTDLLRNDTVAPYSNPLKILISTQEGTIDCDGVAHRTDSHIVLELERIDASEDHRSEVSDRSIEHYFNLTSETLRDIADSETLEVAGGIICTKLKEFTGFDRVMFYRFAPDFHGEVIAEARESDLEPFLGLHYPATDIPRIARELYVQNLIRLIGDVDSAPVGTYPGQLELDMTDCTLRAVSPVHIQYLKNMGVRASMSISLVDDGKLWGLLACHHYAGPLLVPYSQRVSCVHYGMVLSAQLRNMVRHFSSKTVAERQHTVVEEVKALSNIPDMRQAIRDRASQLMSLLEADGMALVMGDQLSLKDSTPTPEIIRKMRERWFDEDLTRIEESDSLIEEFPDADPEDLKVAGFIGFRCSANWTLLFFRNEYVQEIRWAGKPDTDLKTSDPLTPRNSFKEWKETVEGRCRPWSEPDRQIALDLRSALMAFVLQQSLHVDKLNLQLSEKNREIQQFAYSVSHDLKSPLVTINGWIGILDEELRNFESDEVSYALSRIRKAASRMEGLIEDLLAFSKIGHVKIDPEPIDMKALLEELKDEYKMRLQENGVELRLHENLPPLIAHPAEVARVFHNLIDNAIKYGCNGSGGTIEIKGAQSEDFTRYSVSDNGPGIDPAYHTRIFDLFQRVDTQREGTGMGLASVAKIAQLHRGKYGVISEPGEGAEFWVEFYNHLSN